jgi:hypothetical protein
LFNLNTESSIPYLISQRTSLAFPYLIPAPLSTLEALIPPILIVLEGPSAVTIVLPFPSVPKLEEFIFPVESSYGLVLFVFILCI